MEKMKVRLLGGILCVLLGVASCSSLPEQRTQALQLITVEEAAAQDSNEEIYVVKSLNGPAVEIESPDKNFTIATPVSIRVLFKPGTSGKAIDPESFRLVYHKFVKIDLTDRVKEYVTSTGIDAKNVDIPEGKHKISVSVADMAGNRTTEVLKFTVKNPG